MGTIPGSVTSIVDSSMNFIQGYRYTDYGITTRIGSGAFNEFAYTQGIWDSTTGLYYLNARFYNPVDGRFLTQDPYRGSNDQPDTWHLYGYCAGDPINWIDPGGNRRVIIRTNETRRLTRGWRFGAGVGLPGDIDLNARIERNFRMTFRRYIVRDTRRIFIHGSRQARNVTVTSRAWRGISSTAEERIRWRAGINPSWRYGSWSRFRGFVHTPLQFRNSPSFGFLTTHLF